MAKVYATLVRAGSMTIDDVPVLWREQVKELLGE